MRGLRTALTAIVTAALAITTLAAPAAGVDLSKPTIVVVNGIPGTKLDICINGREIRSGLRYGGQRWKQLRASQKVLKVYKKDPRRCRGRLVARRRFDLLPDAKLTIVITSNRPGKVVIFDNRPLTLHHSYAWRHAGELGVEFLISAWDLFLEDLGIDPMKPASQTWRKGDSYSSAWVPGYAYRVRAVRPGTAVSMAGSRIIEDLHFISIEWIFLGTARRNTRFVLVAWPVLDAF